MNPTAPTTAFMSPKNGSIAAKNPQNTTYRVRRTILGIRFLLENIPCFTSADFFSNISYATWEYTCVIFQRKDYHNDVTDKNFGFITYSFLMFGKSQLPLLCSIFCNFVSILFPMAHNICREPFLCGIIENFIHFTTNKAKTLYTSPNTSSL